MIDRKWFKLGLASFGMGAALLAGTMGLPVWAATQEVPLTWLAVEEDVYLPTVYSSQKIQFTKPATWQLLPSSKLVLHLQHSAKLQPHRSWFRAWINDQVVHQVRLTPQNAETTTLEIPVPTNLKGFNTLKLEVFQHYTDRCEDPLDKSLWTQILKSSKFQFQYQPQLPALDLMTFPYPLVDAFAYGPATVQYFLPPSGTPEEYHAMGLVHGALGRFVPKKELHSQWMKDWASVQNNPLVLVGTPSHLPDLSAFAGGLGAFQQTPQGWMDGKTHQPVEPDAGLLFLLRNPQFPEQPVLIVTGNSAKGVLQAAQYLTSLPGEEPPHGPMVKVPSQWSPPEKNDPRPPRYLQDQRIQLRQLGFEDQTVYKINAPPITYRLPVVSQFKEPGARLFLDLNYSYSPTLNPRYSSLEIRLNDRSIQNIPLENPEGEKRQRVTVELPAHLLRSQNELVAQFHMLPDKYGFCKDDYKDWAWGKIDADSELRPEGPVRLNQPDVVTLGQVGFPYTKTQDLRQARVVLPKNPSPETLGAYLGLMGRLGRMTLAGSPFLWELTSEGDPLTADKDILWFGTSPGKLAFKEPYPLTWLPGWVKQYMQINQKPMTVWDSGKGQYLQQQLTPEGNTVTLLASPQLKGYQIFQHLFEEDAYWRGGKLDPDLPPPGALKQILPDDDVSRGVWGNVMDPKVQPVAIQKPWYEQIPWMQVGQWALGGIFLMWLLGSVLRRLKRRR